MAVTVKEWVQREWTRSRVDLYNRPGDFYNLSGLSPDTTRRALRRSPAWSAHLTHSGLTDVRGMFYDENTDRVVLLGTNAASHLASTYFSSAWSHVGSTYELTSATTNVAGGTSARSMRNVLFFGGYLYVIGANGHVYRGGSYTSGLSDFYSTADAVCLAALGGRVYMASTYGKIWRHNSSGSAFETHFDSISNFYPLFMTAFRGYLLIVGKQDDGSIHIYSLPQTPNYLSASTLREIVAIPAASANYPSYGSLFAVHEDKLYFSPGRYTNPDGTKVIDIYRFNGSQIEPVARIPDTVASPNSAGLIHWRGELIFYAPASTGTQNYKMLVGDHFVDAIPGTINVTGLSAIAASLGGELVTVGLDASSNHGIHHAGGSDLQDGYLQTSWLDMGSPSALKRLERITALLNGRASDFKILLKYRANDAADWTTAVTANNTRRAHIANLGVEFYQIQLRVDLDDDTAGDQDIRITAISAMYKE